jgi:ring-1,2-phenylacetyl-CoA epoxidase subunit PaaD
VSPADLGDGDRVRLDEAGERAEARESVVAVAPPGGAVATDADVRGRARRAADRVAAVWAVLDTVLDPEVPALSVCDLGLVRGVMEVGENAVVEIVLTPTYSGCPATEVIEREVVGAVEAAGLGPARVRLQRAPAWTSDWISERGRTRLRAYGIAPPGPVVVPGEAPIRLVPRLVCPRCGSKRTERLAAFGSTACKALHRCLACLEPFEHFKPI